MWCSQKAKDARNGYPSYRRAGNARGNQKDSKNSGRFFNAKGAFFPSKYAEETESPLKAVRPTEGREASKGLMVQIALRRPGSLLLLMLSPSPFPPAGFCRFLLHFILSNRDLILSTPPFDQSETILFLGPITWENVHCIRNRLWTFGILALPDHVHMSELKEPYSTVSLNVNFGL